MTLVNFLKSFGHFLKKFTGFTSVLIYMLIASFFQRCVEFGPQRPNLGSIWGPKISQNSGLWSFSQKKSLVSHQYCFTCSLQVLLDVWRLWASEVQFWGPKINKNSGLWSFSQKCSTGFALVLVYMSIWATFRGVLNIVLIGDPVSGSFWAPK